MEFHCVRLSDAEVVPRNGRFVLSAERGTLETSLKYKRGVVTLDYRRLIDRWPGEEEDGAF